VRESQPFVWRWRDWIIESLNADKGYDQMIVEMLAGDELAPDDPATLRATGYLVRNWFRYNRHVWLDNSVEHTSKAFLGITVNCARCHDHMYDPIPQQDYYRFRAFFEPHDIRIDRVPGQPDTTKDGLVRVFDAKPAEPTYLFVRGNDKQPDKDHPLTPGVPDILRAGQPDVQIASVTLPSTSSYPGLRQFVQDETLAVAQKYVKDLADMVTGLKSKLDAADETTKTNYALLEKMHAEAQASLIAVQARIAADSANFSSPPADNAKGLALAAGKAEREFALRKADREAFEAEQALSKSRRELEAKPTDDKLKKAVTDAEKKVDEAKKALAAARADIDKPKEDYSKLTPTYPATSTGRRLTLARWIASKQNPLTARVAINHLWLRHFGQPLVPTVFDFGLNGKPPTHPALLDWLAVELMEREWRMKSIHRLIVTSMAYRQDSKSGAASGGREAPDREPVIVQSGDLRPPLADALARDLDPDNRLVWRFNSRRLEAEAVRDATLAVAGNLDRTMFGVELDQNSGLTVPRRSIYFRSSKEKKMTYLSLFDTANVTECYRRSESIIPQQALAQANSPLSLAQARLLAKSLTAEVGSDANSEAARKFVSIAFEQVLNRPPTTDELATCEQFLGEQSQLFAAKQSLTAFNAGAANLVKPSDDPQQRARENLIHVLLNHNDFLTIR
jgi:hypothetical protein